MSKPGRLTYLDLLRGWACLLMFQTHAYHAWCNPAAKTTAAYKYTRLAGGLAAPLFLFLAGVSLVLMHDALVRKGLAERDVRRKIFLRGLWIFAAAFLFRMQAYAFQWGRAKWEGILRVDVLNCIGMALLIVGAILMLSQRYRFWAFAGGAIAVSFATPLIYDLDLRSHLPRLAADYINGRPPSALFPLFPWVAFSLAGAAVAVLMLRAGRDAANVRGFVNLVGAGSVATIFIAYLADRAPVSLYPSYNFWLTSPQYWAIRLACLGLLLVVCFYWRRMVPSPHVNWVELLGRHSLLVYWIHVEIVYGRATGWLKGKESFPAATFWLAALTASMILLSFLIEVLKGNRKAIRA